MLIIGFVLPYVQMVYGAIIMFVSLHVLLGLHPIYQIYASAIVILVPLMKMVCVLQTAQHYMLILTLVFVLHLVPLAAINNL